MPASLSLTSLRKPAVLFCVGWAIVILSLTVSVPPVTLVALLGCVIGLLPAVVAPEPRVVAA